jgi:hypothetical protein
MSNIQKVIALVDLNKGADKNVLVDKIVKTLGVTKANAQVYLYNANKKMGNPTSTGKRGKKAVTLAPVGKDAKAKNLETIKSVAKSRKKLDEEAMKADRDAKLAEIDTYMDEEVAPFVASLTAPARKTFQLAE